MRYRFTNRLGLVTLTLLMLLSISPLIGAQEQAISGAVSEEEDEGLSDLDSLLGTLAEDEQPVSSGPEALATDLETSGSAEKNQDDSELNEEPQRVAPKRKTLEEIVVVAQKKAESIQDVPISISVIDDQFIEDWSISDLNTAVLYTPNVKIADAGFFILPRIRGFGTDQNNKAFEPPAGVAIDGIPYTRLEYFTSALFDVERMEVYRGPQGTAFGKNTTAGVIHLITKSPTDEMTGFLDYQYGDFERRRIEAGVGGPLVDGFLNFRLAGLSDERQGFVENSATSASLTGAPEFGRGNSRQGVRFKLDFLDLLGSSLKLSLEKVDIESIGAGIELFDVSDPLKAVIRRYEPNTDFERANYINSINDPDFRKIGLETFNAEWNYGIGEWGVVALGGYSVLDSESALDTDITPVPAIFGTDKDRSPTTTAEFRLESPSFEGLFGLNDILGLDLGTSNFLAGYYYQKRVINGDGIAFRFGLSYLDLLLAGQASNPNNPQLNALLDPLLTALFPLIPPVLGGTNSSYTEEVTQDFDQKAEADAWFGQFQWQFLPEWGVEYGIRFSKEEKTATLNQFYSSDTAILLPLLDVREYSANLARKEDNTAQRVSLNFEPSDELGIFLHWARGFRGGGFNAFSFTGERETLEFEPETATDWGLDFKTTWLDNRLRLNVSLFRLEVDDFQVLVGQSNERGVGLGTSTVENASKARSQGVEADMTWLVTNWFTLFSTLGVNDTEYLDFTTNRCFPDNPNTDGDDDPRCDATGKPFPLTPKYTATMLGMTTIPLSRSGLVMQVGGGFDFQTEQFANTSLDPRYITDDVTRWRATIGIGNVLQGWSFRIQGENLTNEIVNIRQGQIVRGAVVEGVEAPRTIYGSFRYNF